ncbi:MAG: hypothetical protein JSS96_05615 [Bacteroidetes bacterium]|nr:hypothetical protein [Bacteroidota bacterium]
MKRTFLMLLLMVLCSGAFAQSDSSNGPLVIGDQKSFKLSKDQLKNDYILHLVDAYKGYKIKSYQISYKSKEKGTEFMGPYGINGNSLAVGEAAKIINEAQPGDRIFIEEIVAESKDANKPSMKFAAAIRVL